MELPFLLPQPVYNTLPDDSLELIQLNRMANNGSGSLPGILMEIDGAGVGGYGVSMFNGPPDLSNYSLVPGAQAFPQGFRAAMVLGGLDSVPSGTMESSQLSSVGVGLSSPCQGINLNSMANLLQPPNMWHQGSDIASWTLPDQSQPQSSTSPVSSGDMSGRNISARQMSSQAKTTESEALYAAERGNGPGNGQGGPAIRGDGLRSTNSDAGSMSPSSHGQDDGCTSQTLLSPPQLRSGAEGLNDCLEKGQSEPPTEQHTDQEEPTNRDKPTDQGNYIDLTGCEDEPLVSHQPAKHKLEHLIGSPEKGIDVEQVNLRAEEVSWSLEGKKLVYKWGPGNKFWVNNSSAADRLQLHWVFGEVLFSERENITITVRPNLMWWPIRVRWNSQMGLYEGHGPGEEHSRLEVKSEDMFEMLCGSRDAQGRTGTYIWLGEESS